MAKRFTSIIFAIAFIAYIAVAILLAGLFLPKSIGYQVRIVETGSMVPTIPIGSAVFIRPRASYAVGDIITFQHPGDALPTTHRIVSATSTNGAIEYSTRGDANNASDWQPTPQRDVIGKEWLIVPFLGYVLNFLRTPIGIIVIVIIPAGLVFYGESRKSQPKPQIIAESEHTHV